MRARQLPVFFLVNWIGVFVAALAIGGTFSMLVLHDHVGMTAIVDMSLIAAVYSASVTTRERARRQRVAEDRG
jgi:putative methionine-R-sulfoxide reductase with GAF domain